MMIHANANIAESEKPVGISKNKSTTVRDLAVGVTAVLFMCAYGILNPTLLGTFAKAADKACGNVEWGDKRKACAVKELNRMGENAYPIGLGSGDEISMMVGNQGMTFKATRHHDYRSGQKNSYTSFESLR